MSNKPSNKKPNPEQGITYIAIALLLILSITLFVLSCLLMVLAANGLGLFMRG